MHSWKCYGQGAIFLKMLPLSRAVSRVLGVRASGLSTASLRRMEGMSEIEELGTLPTQPPHPKSLTGLVLSSSFFFVNSILLER